MLSRLSYCRRFSVLLLSLFLAVGFSSVEAALDLSASTATSHAPLPDAVGRAGMAAGAVVDSEDKPVILAVGGANFPDKLPWEGGKKVFYSDIYKIDKGQWTRLGALPEPVAYAAFASTAKGLVLAGGANETGHINRVYLIQPEGTVMSLPSLPKSLAYPAFSQRNGRLYVFSGQETPESTTALKDAYSLDIANLDAAKIASLQWELLPPMPVAGRILSTASATGSQIFIIGGASLSSAADGTPQRTYLSDVIAYNSATKEWTVDNFAALPIPLVASPNPAPAREGKILVLGGDTGAHYGKDAQTHPGQSSDIFIYDTQSNTWSTGGKWHTGIATAPAVVLGETVYTISGETKPGIRTPLVQQTTLSYSFELTKVDYLVFSLVVLVLSILFWQAKAYGIRNIALVIDPKNRPSTYAWIVVALLWVVAMLNYFDRQLLTTIREPIIRDIPQTEMQFGLLTGVFLIIYSVLSPVGGFLADKYSRRLVILCSLVVWSIVTWITGHVHDYTTLFIARALMGVSEACYIPAALALITDYHRGKTRSLATGIHMSGVYAGMAMAGLGGSMADALGWRLTFGLFGLVGVAYALVLVIFLKDPSKVLTSEQLIANDSLASKVRQEDGKPIKTPGLGYVLKNILGCRPIWILMVVVACGGAANWFLLAWFPTLLLEKFNMSLGEAGTNATLWSTMAKYVAVLVGAIIADQWSAKNPRGRSLLTGIVFCAAAPLIALSPFIPAEMTGALALLLVFVASQGLAQGTMDATLMPIMRSYIDGRFAATGYGFLNLVSAGFGAVTVIYGGKLKDMGVELGTTLAYTGGLLLIGGVLLLALPKPKPKPQELD